MYLIGVAPKAPCPVCNVSPVPLREIQGFPELAECARCGLPYAVRTSEGNALPEAQLAVSMTVAGILKQYYCETGRKLGLLGLPVDPVDLGPEHAARAREMDEWLQQHRHLLAAASASSSWPYVSVIGLRTEINDAPAWHIIGPPTNRPESIIFPVDPGPLPMGSVVVISVPFDAPVEIGDEAEPEEGEEPAGNA